MRRAGGERKRRRMRRAGGERRRERGRRRKRRSREQAGSGPGERGGGRGQQRGERLRGAADREQCAAGDVSEVKPWEGLEKVNNPASQHTCTSARTQGLAHAHMCTPPAWHTDIHTYMFLILNQK